MNFCHIMAGKLPPVTSDPVHVVHGHLGLGVAHPHRGGEVRRVAAEPGVVPVGGRAGLAGGRAVDVGLGAGAALDVLLQDAGHLVGHAGRDGLGLSWVGLPDHVAVGVRDPQDDGRLDVLPAVGQGGVGRGHLQRRHAVLEAAQGDGRVRR